MTSLFKFDSKSTSVLDKNEFREHVESLLKNAEKSVLVCSGFVKQEGVKWLKKHIKSDVKCTILTFWSAKHLLDGGSDLKAYEFCHENNWDFHQVQGYHGKAIQIDKSYVAVGSSNLTQRGFGLIPFPNEETGVIKEMSILDEEYFDKLLQSSYKVTYGDYVKLKEWYEENKIKKNKISYPSLPVSFEPENKIDIKRLWTDDFPILSFHEFSDYKEKDDFYKHELDLFDVNEFNREIIKDRFKKTYIFNWTKNILENNDRKLYFGTMTDIIHNTLLDDARQYRRDVKRLQANLYSYIREFDYDEVKLSTPGRRSELLELASSQ